MLARRAYGPLLLFGFVAGLLGEGLMLLKAHGDGAERLLLEDFRVVAFLEREIPQDRLQIAQEKVLALAGSDDVRYVSPEQSLAELRSRDPALAESVALVGRNPLPGAFEVRLNSERLAIFEGWLAALRAVPEVEEVRYKPLELGAALQVRFYRRFSALLLNLSACALALYAAFRLGRRALRPDPISEAFGRPEEARRRAASAAAGAAAGMALTAAMSALAAPPDLMQAWPPAWSQALFLALAALAGLLLPAPEPAAPAQAAKAVRGTGAVSAALCAAVLLHPAAQLHAGSLRAKRQELKALTKDLEEKKRAFETYRRREGSLQSDLRKLRRDEAALASLVERLRSERRQAQREKGALGGRMEALELARARGAEVLAEEAARYVVRLAQDSDVYGLQGLWEEAFLRAALVEKSAYLTRLDAVRSRTGSRRESALARDIELRERTLQELSRLRAKRERYENSLRDFEALQRKAARTRKEILDLQASARELSSLVDRLQASARRPSARQAKGAPAVARNSLPWPVAGRLVGSFGKRHVPELGTWVIRNGIEISTKEGSAVHAVAAGKVIFAGPFRSYGNVLILEHDGGFYSIYGGLGRMLRKVGDGIRAGAQVATVGPDVDGRSGHLYLELRQGRQAVNPLVWLKRQ